MRINSFHDLKVLTKSHNLVLHIYRITKAFPSDERFSLTDQIRRSASAVSTNIVEGNARRFPKEFLQFLNIAYSSLEETKYHLLLSKDLGYITDDEYNLLTQEAEEVSKMISSLNKYLKSKI